jgi:hypothetical protein
MRVSRKGGGSIPNDLKVIVNKEAVQAEQVHVVRLRKRQGFSNKASYTLPEGVVEPLDMSR